MLCLRAEPLVGDPGENNPPQRHPARWLPENNPPQRRKNHSSAGSGEVFTEGNHSDSLALNPRHFAPSPAPGRTFSDAIPLTQVPMLLELAAIHLPSHAAASPQP